ncbi:hypothetical protein [Jeotgalibacillus sp. R-1-5s-1]|uniref:hypothetical protein n=1 Tax=Jeotgalibacillus sp. R-1-5s-1 TaxID=2555897 RepID=UPI00106D1A8A|nr:hypothetical protein [Jeotgalibacillus sp. R-1-5s-1]TFE00823.1 hypothetical protein E2491_04755 [Jeotgalibacillus sp. R-1-5s-1]
MTETKRIQTNAWLMLLFIPLFVTGYMLAVYEESLFGLFEWGYWTLISALFIFAVWNTTITKGPSKWAATSMAAFLMQLAVLSLFLGPFSIYSMFFVFYAVAAVVLITFILALKKTDRFKGLIALFLGLSIVMVVYMAVIQSLWGVNWM